MADHSDLSYNFRLQVLLKTFPLENGKALRILEANNKGPGPLHIVGSNWICFQILQVVVYIWRMFQLFYSSLALKFVVPQFALETDIAVKGLW